MAADMNRDLIQRLPKTDLHLHLDGSLRLHSLVEMARVRGVALPSESEDGLRQLVFRDRYQDLGDYLRGFAYTVAVLQDAEAWYALKAAYEALKQFEPAVEALKRAVALRPDIAG